MNKLEEHFLRNFHKVELIQELVRRAETDKNSGIIMDTWNSIYLDDDRHIKFKIIKWGK